MNMLKNGAGMLTMKWQGKVHERIVGIKNLSQIPPNEQLALHHPKTINRQERQNKFYESI